MATFLLVPSPLVGPDTWAPTATALAARGIAARVAELREPDGGEPFWAAHARSAADRADAAAGPPVLVGHSGAGPILPAVADAMGRAPAAYVFVDAGLPRDGVSRLDALAREDADLGDALRQHLEQGGRFPEWSDEDLAEAVPDPERRAALVAGLRPRALPFWDEALAVPAAWPDAPCAYLRFGEGYAVPSAEARRAGWAYEELPGQHFHPVVDPDAVADALVRLAQTATALTDGVRRRLLVAVAAGGALGALLRVGLVELVPPPAHGLPWTTLLVNVSGTFLLGWLATRLLERLPPSTYARPFLGTGLCGAYTTFSTVQVEVVRLLHTGRAGVAVAYAVLSLVAGALAVVLATGLARRARVRLA